MPSTDDKAPVLRNAVSVRTDGEKKSLSSIVVASEARARQTDGRREEKGRGAAAAALARGIKWALNLSGRESPSERAS